MKWQQYHQQKVSLGHILSHLSLDHIIIAQVDARVSLVGDLGRRDYWRSRLLVPAMSPFPYYLTTIPQRLRLRTGRGYVHSLVR
jgi:hypothetical protein